jgi:hypothetical protein
MQFENFIVPVLYRVIKHAPKLHYLVDVCVTIALWRLKPHLASASYFSNPNICITAPSWRLKPHFAPSHSSVLHHSWLVVFPATQYQPCIYSLYDADSCGYLGLNYGSVIPCNRYLMHYIFQFILDEHIILLPVAYLSLCSVFSLFLYESCCEVYNLVSVFIYVLY